MVRAEELDTSHSLQQKGQVCLTRDGSWWFISTEDLLPPWVTIQGQGSPENSVSMLCILQLLKTPGQVRSPGSLVRGWGRQLSRLQMLAPHVPGHCQGSLCHTLWLVASVSPACTSLLSPLCRKQVPLQSSHHCLGYLAMGGDELVGGSLT